MQQNFISFTTQKTSVKAQKNDGLLLQTFDIVSIRFFL